MRKPCHAVQIIGIDRSNPENPMVILNDPGIPDGRGITVPADEFVNAWADSNYFMVYTTDNATVNNQDYLAALHSDTLREKTIGGYYNADGSYHYTSDNIDRDPETGAIIRQW